MNKNEAIFPQYEVLHSLHRPFHRPLWIVKWVCFFFLKRQSAKKGFFVCEDPVLDLYFTLIRWFYEKYPEDNDGIPSSKAVESVYSFFETKSISEKYKSLKEILSKSERNPGVEKQIYSTYKACTYYLNLAKEKLHFMDSNYVQLGWDESVLKRWHRCTTVNKYDRMLYMKQLLRYDGYFFLSICALHRYGDKYGLKLNEIIFDFMQRYYPIPRFDYTNRSHSNYYEVRSHWILILQALNSNGSFSIMLKKCIQSDMKLQVMYDDIQSNLAFYLTELKSKRIFINQKKEFYQCYRELHNSQDDRNDFVNLYDICRGMKMSYEKFNIFLSDFYEEERMRRNIFFINIVSTIDQRKRFYVREIPVLKIKISQ